ncbi:DUF2442 domain-containing protein [Hyphomonadaceae bacterium ML37]|nr:DUF2442 domain-containing protein [Hyphomonadaceae bacterium ML37]
MIKLIHMKPTGPASLHLTFSDGQAGELDLSALIARPGAMVLPLRDPAYFARVFLEDGAPTWPNGFDLAPWALHRDMDAQGLLKPAGQAA